ncbi:MAG: hypothetical protein B7733_09645 [Myxococcales bacterium FL481]|nr:MAG: hypothetical protein B7733_09645 [Myxococcales bacterium FL481]
MRVTEIRLHQLGSTSIRDARERLMEAQRVAVSGARVNELSDDPASAARARLARSLMHQAESHQRSIELGNLQLERAEQALSEVSNLLVRAKELTLAMANETITASQRSLAAQEINELRLTAIDLANTKAGNEYVFAHVNTTSPPVDAAGTFTYDVNTYQTVREAEVGPSSRAEIGSSASLAFAQRVADPGSIDVFVALSDLVADLNANDPDAVRAAVDDLDSAHDQVVAERARIGLRTSRLTTAQETATAAQDVYRQLESDLVDADAAEAFSYLNLAETGLQASLAVTSRILGPSLLDMM